MLHGKKRLAKIEAETSNIKINEKIEYRVVDKLEEGDYIFIHWNGFVYKANDYPYNLRDGVANRDLMVGEVVDFIPGEDTRDIARMPSPVLKNFFSRGVKNIYEQREEDSSVV